MRELILDANVLVRFLVQDVPQQAKAARKLVEQAESGAFLLVVDPMIIAEAVYVLTSFYKKPREAVADALIAFVQSDGVSVARGIPTRGCVASIPALAGGFRRCLAGGRRRGNPT